MAGLNLDLKSSETFREDEIMINRRTVEVNFVKVIAWQHLFGEGKLKTR